MFEGGWICSQCPVQSRQTRVHWSSCPAALWAAEAENDGTQKKTFLFCSVDSGKPDKPLSYNGREPCYEIHVIDLVSFPDAVIKFHDNSNLVRERCVWWHSSRYSHTWKGNQSLTELVTWHSQSWNKGQWMCECQCTAWFLLLYGKGSLPRGWSCCN